MIVWVCERCGTEQMGNPLRCHVCGYTIYRPTFPERAGWRRDAQMEAWVNGRHAIGDEILVMWRREQVQSYAIEKTGLPLPDEAFELARPVRLEPVYRSIAVD